MNKGWKGNSQKHALASRGIKSKDVMSYLEKQGLAYKKGITEKDVNPKELKMGIEIEMEHTSDPKLAKKIALDHLAEHKYYYSNLKIYEDRFSQPASESLFGDLFDDVF